MDDANNEGSLAGLKVMVIDDSKTIRRTAETLLKKEGCDVVTATAWLPMHAAEVR